MSEPDVKAIVERYEPNHYKHSPASMVRHEDGDYVRYSDHLALISQLTAERDAAVKSADTAWDKCEDRRIEAHDNWLRAEAAEKRVKELEVERDALRDRLGYCYRRYAWAEN